VRSRPRWFVAAFLLTFVTLTRGDAPVSVRLRYRATAGCPTHGEFVEAVRARTPLARFGEEAGAWEVAVSAQSTAGTSVGVLSGQGTVPREVSAKSCADVISALALILALAIDPQASTTPAPLPSAEASAAPPVLAAPPASAAPPPAPEPKASLAPPPPDQPPPGTPASAGAFWGFGAALDGSFPFTSSWVSLVGPAASLELGARWTPIFSPSLRLTGALNFGSTATAAASTASFRLARVRLDLRPVRLELAPPLFLVPHAGIEIGQLTGEGEVGTLISEAQTRSRDWLALAQGVAFELTLVEPIFVTLSGEIREPLYRYNFVFQAPHTEVAEVPAVEFGWSAGLGARFW
jgi:hypothetical protein